ncbi:MAG TPA: hypothetical protein VFU21_32395 [Kofleriaceae bacterium]|nr:hypothetical protein [Kofleriaceae bacterium]
MFSLGWVVVSYFLICGGVCAAAAGYAAVGARDPGAGHAAFFVGAALGGVLSGRASPHRSYLEPALAAALVVASLMAFVYATPMGRLGVAMARSEANVDVWRHAAIAGGLGFAGGFFGAVIGEATQPRSPGLLPLRWLLLAIFIGAGALFAATTAAVIALANDAAKAALAQMWTGGIDPSKPLVTEDRVIVLAAAAAATTAVLSGVVTQLGAPKRMLLPAFGGTFLVMSGALLAVAAAGKRLGQFVGPALAFGALAGAVAMVGALVTYAIRRGGGRVE